MRFDDRYGRVEKPRRIEFPAPGGAIGCSSTGSSPRASTSFAGAATSAPGDDVFGGQGLSVLRLAQKAFHPGESRFRCCTSTRRTEMYEFRDHCAELGCGCRASQRAAIASASADLGTVAAVPQDRACSALAEPVDAVIGGARREEERSRAKERIFSFRDRHGQWDPKAQRPELWSLYNTQVGPGESLRVFPLSNWTELDIWRYIEREAIPVVPLYFAREREMVERGEMLIPVGAKTRLLPGESARRVLCRFRTLGCYPCTGAVASTATTVAEIIAELEQATHSERITRVIDHDRDGPMEQKKREGYF